MANHPDRPCRVLVTGACGFLGRAIVRQAAQAGLDVRRTDRLEQAPDEAAPYTQADVRTAETLGPVVDGVDAVIHAAGLAHVFDKSRGAAEFVAVNDTGTANVARAAGQAGVRQFVLVSSVSVYGGGAYGPREDAPCLPRTAYALSKYGGELRAAEAAEEADMGLTILRMATLYGEGDPGNVARLVRAIDRGRFLWIGRGHNRKSLLYRDDAARACVQAVLRPASGARTYNVSAEPCTMDEIVSAIAAHLDRPVPRWRVPGWLALGGSALASAVCLGRGPLASVHRAVRTWLAHDVYPADKIAQDLSCRATVSLNEGLAREVAWYKKVAAPHGERSESQTAT